MQEEARKKEKGAKTAKQLRESTGHLTTDKEELHKSKKCSVAEDRIALELVVEESAAATTPSDVPLLWAFAVDKDADDDDDYDYELPPTKYDDVMTRLMCPCRPRLLNNHHPR